jgi:nitroreductase
MELREAIRARRMERQFDPDVPVGLDVLRDLVDLGTRAPSAGFSQGWAYLGLVGEETTTFWEATTSDEAPDGWLRRMRTAPALLLCLSDPDAYLDRYAEPDKGWTDRSLDHWPVPYWDTDVAMGAMLVLLGAVDRGLGALFFGVPADRHAAAKAALGIPDRLRIVGVVALGTPVPHPRSPSLRRGRRGVAEVLHLGRYGDTAHTGTPPR